MAARWLLGIGALVFLALGANGLVNPVGHLAPYDLALRSPAWLGEVRANYGGMHLGIGLLLAFGAWLPDWRRTGLAVMLVFLGGLAAGRTLSVIVDGVPPGFAFAFIAIEWLGAAAALVLLRRQA